VSVRVDDRILTTEIAESTEQLTFTTENIELFEINEGIPVCIRRVSGTEWRG